MQTPSCDLLDAPPTGLPAPSTLSLLPDEQDRLEALYRTDLLDTEAEPEFDELVRMAAEICGTPISVISLVDEHRQWFKATIGIEARETPRPISFCTHAIQKADLTIVENATLDPRFAQNPLVTGDMNVRFYAGMPIHDPEGHRLGTLCVIDSHARDLNNTQRIALRALASQVNVRIEMRMQRRALERALSSEAVARAGLAASEQRFRLFMDNGPFLSFLKDDAGHMLLYNKQLAAHYGVSMTDFLGRHDNEIWPSDHAEAYRKGDDEALRTGQTFVQVERSRRIDGTYSTFRTWKFPIFAPDGSAFVGGISVDVTEELQREAQLQDAQLQLEARNRELNQLALTDSLTGLPNRRAFDNRMQHEFGHARRMRRDLSVLMIDVDHFKRRNDLYGHKEGDDTLAQLAQLIRSCCRNHDMLARYGGEEFVLLLPETSEAQALVLVDRIFHAIRSTPWPHQPVTISAGIAPMSASTPSHERVLQQADQALYAAKRTGRDRLVTYDTAVALGLIDVGNEDELASLKKKCPCCSR